MEVIRGHHCSIFMRVYLSVSMCMSVSVCVIITLVQVLDCVMHVEVTLRHIHMRPRVTCICTVTLFTGFKRENRLPEFQPLLIVLELFNRKPREIWLGRDSCTDNSSLMLAPCHSYLLTPSVPLGADRLIGSYCSTSESEEGKLRPLPLLSCFPLSFYCPVFPELPLVIPRSFSLSPSFSKHLKKKKKKISWISPICLPTRFLLVSPFVPVPPSHLAVSSFHHTPPPSSPALLPSRICHSHSPSLFISRLYVSVYPGLECHKQLGRSHSLLLHLLA